MIMQRYKDVVLVGSLTKYLGEFKRVRDLLKSEGIACEMPVIYFHHKPTMIAYAKNPTLDLVKKPRTREEDMIGTKMHITKVCTGDIIYVVNRPGGYVGNSTSAEIGYADGVGAEIYSEEEISDAAVQILIPENHIVLPERLIEIIKNDPIDC